MSLIYLRELQAAVEDAYCLKRGTLAEDNRKAPVAEARLIYYHVAREQGLTLREIGEAIGRDTSSVSGGATVMARRIGASPYLYALAMELPRMSMGRPDFIRDAERWEAAADRYDESAEHLTNAAQSLRDAAAGLRAQAERVA